MTGRRGRSAVEFAHRWHVPETTALVFLHDFREQGIAIESRGLWYATNRARTYHRWLAPISDETRERRMA